MARRQCAFGAIAAMLALMAVGCGGGTRSASSATSTSASPETNRVGAAASTTAPVAGNGVVVTTKDVKLGTVLGAGPRQRTVYLFEADHGSTSACSGACARIWPPVITKDAPRVGGEAIPADLGVITRANGTKQVTYFHHPLYYYSKDKNSRDVYGHAIKSFGSTWYPLRTIGVKFDKPWA
jgi:predicted lipoprotein with Yx(FWY)xxD motif